MIWIASDLWNVQACLYVNKVNWGLGFQKKLMATELHNFFYICWNLCCQLLLYIHKQYPVWNNVEHGWTTFSKPKFGSITCYCWQYDPNNTYVLSGWFQFLAISSRVFLVQSSAFPSLGGLSRTTRLSQKPHKLVPLPGGTRQHQTPNLGLCSQVSSSQNSLTGDAWFWFLVLQELRGLPPPKRKNHDSWNS